MGPPRSGGGSGPHPSEVDTEEDLPEVDTEEDPPEVDTEEDSPEVVVEENQLRSTAR